MNRWLIIALLSQGALGFEFTMHPVERCQMYLGSARTDFTVQVLPGPVVAPGEWDAARLGKPFPTEAQLMAATGGTNAQESDALAVAWAETQLLPATFEHSIAIPGPAGHWYEAVVEDGEIVPVQISNSPLDPAKREAMKAARLASNRVERAELRRDVVAVRTNMQALVTTTTTAPAQQQQIEELRRAVRDLSGVVRKMLKEVGP